jgi:hypothetical protein
MTGLLQCRLGNKDVKIRLDTAVAEKLDQGVSSTYPPGVTSPTT